MRFKKFRLLTVILLLVASANGVYGQNCLNTGLNGSVLNLPCHTNCVTIPVKLPNIKQTTDYAFNTIPYTPYAFSTPSGNEVTSIYTDDDYSAAVTLPFGFCFYDSIYNQVVIGSNGLITFDIANASCDNGWTINQAIPYAGGSPCTLPGPYVPRASIMGAYSDLDPRTLPDVSASPADRKIEWRIEGSAPCRKFICSFYHIGVFGSQCGLTTPNTFQIVLYESTGVIEMYFEQKACVSSTTDGHAIMGIQNWDQDQAIAGPGKNNTVWNETLTAYRFTPSGGQTRFVSSEAYDFAGNLLDVGDTATTVPGILDVTFPDFCPPGNTGQYIVRTKFKACDDPNNILQSNDTITINKTQNLDATVALTQTSCGLQPDGTATVSLPNPTGGIAPFTYVIAPVIGAANGTGGFTGLSAGDYTFTVTDNSGCSSVIDTAITSTGTLTVDYTAFATSCYGAANGGLNIDPINGTAPFVYTVNPALPPNLPITNSTGVYNSLIDGDYFLSVADAAGCKADLLPFTVEPGESITMDADIINPSCPGAYNGSITVLPTGTGPYTFYINAANPQTSPVFTGLSAAGPPDGSTYFIDVTDAEGCKIIFYPVTIVASPSAVTGTAQASATSCSGASDGTVTIVPYSGPGPFDYSIDNGVTWQTSTTFTGLAAGSYSVLIREAGICQSAPIPAVISAGASITAALTTTSTDCAGVDNGTITVTPDVAFTGPFEYSLDGGTYQTSNNFTNVASGPHDVMIRNTGGCSSASLPVTVNAGTTLTGSATSTSTDCAGVDNGSVTVTEGTGFTGPFEYSIDGGGYQTSNTFTNIAAGNHNVRVRSAAGCESNDIPVTVNAGTTLTGSATSTSTACAGVSNGSITVTEGTGFTGPFEYSLDGGAYQATNTFPGVAAGNHLVRVRSVAGCESNDIPVTVAAGTVLTGTASMTPITCFGANNGVITATATNGSGPYTFALDGAPAQATGVFNSVTNGAHNVIIYDSYGCISNQVPVTVTQPAALTAVTPAVQNVNCYAELNGSITVNPAGGTNPYTYSLDNVTFAPTNVFNVGEGTYNIWVKDANGCTIQLNNINVTQPAVLNATIVAADNATCGGGSDGRIEVNAVGGTAPYQYSSGGAFQTSNVLLVDPGTYSVVVKDAHGCEFVIDDVIVGLTDNLVVAAAQPAPICEGTSVQLTATGNGASFTWTPGTGLGSATGSVVTASPTSTTTYEVTATLGRCTATANVLVNVMAAPVPDAGGEATICYGQDYQLQAAPAGMTSYTWSPATFLTDANIANPVAVQPNRTLVYTLNVVDANNCASLIPSMLTLNVTPPIKVQVSPVDTVVSPGALIQLTATSIATDYTWTPATGLSNPAIANPVATAPGVGQELHYQVIARTAADCIGEAYVTIKVYEGPEIYVPSGFSPNGDGVNDLFIPFPVGIKQMNYFRIFNRWGQIIYSTSTLHAGWDGKLAGVEQATGVYVWMVEGVTQDNKVIRKKGTVTLMR